MGMVILEAIGPRGEELAMAAADARDFPVGWDSEFDSATFDVDGIDDAELLELLQEELGQQDPDWREHLQVVE
jgi:hypothetical protein